MQRNYAVLTIGIVALAACARSQPITSKAPVVNDCKHASYARPGVGHAYKGAISNEDYEFSARVPSGLTAWDGVDKSAPFHGFMIFLESNEQSCILFEIHLRIDESDTVPPLKSPPILLGKAEGFQTSSVGMIDGVRVSNVTTSFSFKRPGRIDDGIILLVAPESQMRRALPIYDEFLHSVSFGRR